MIKHYNNHECNWILLVYLANSLRGESRGIVAACSRDLSRATERIFSRNGDQF